MKCQERLFDILHDLQGLTIAVSGGVDSTLLAYIANLVLGQAVKMVHAISPAVPATATERVKRYAKKGNWQLHIVDAGEFDDPRYRSNPVNRCYYCKLNLYETITSLCTGPVASGTNCDDLNDYRPGLIAARERGVLHPYLEASMNKQHIYKLAKRLGLEDLAALPAQPCLASRLETGLYVQRNDLEFVEKLEAAMQKLHGASAVLRCRILHQGVVLELADELLSGRNWGTMSIMAKDLCAAEGRPFLGVRAYRRGAAFLVEAKA